MDEDLSTPTSSNVHPFLRTVRGAQLRSCDYVKLDIDARNLEAGLKKEMKRWTPITRLQNFIWFHFWLVAAIIVLVIAAFITHFWSLNVVTEVTNTDPLMSYEQMVEYHNAATRKANHLNFASNISMLLAVGVAVYIAICASIQKNWMKL